MATSASHAPEVVSSPYTLVLEAHGADTLQMPDAALVFRGEYARSGPDLVITGLHGEKALVVDYFGLEHPPALMSPNGAILDGDLVSQLAGPRFAQHYAQASPSTQAAAVGQVEAVSGSVTISHGNGTRTQAAIGSPVFEGDVVETGPDGRLSITFADKTVASLSEGARIVIDKFVYEAGGSQNSMLVNLVQGAFVFVAGLVAPSGDMKVQTPVATMGIRGTTGVVRADVQDGTSYFTLKPDPAGKLGEPGGGIGAFDVFARLSGVLIKEVRVPDQLLIVRSAAGQFEDIPQVGSNESAFQQEILNFAFASHQMMLTRTEGGQPPVQEQRTPGQRGDAGSSDTTQHAGLSPAPDHATFFHTPLNVDLVKQAAPLGSEDGSQGMQQSGTGSTSDVQSLAPALLATDPFFTSAPISVVFEQQAGGIHGSFPVTFSSPNGSPVSIVKVVTTVTAVSIGSDGQAVAFELTPEQIQAFAKAFDPATGQFHLDIDTSFLAAGQQVVVTVGITIADAQGHTTTQTQAFSIHGLNDAPVVDTAAAAAPDAGTQALAGSAYLFDDSIVLHPLAGAPGAVWQPVSIASDAHWDVKGYFGSGDFAGQGFGSLADGIAFVFQAQGPTAVGAGGGGLGVEGLKHAFGVKFDTYSNAGEPAYTFAQFFTTDAAGHVTYYTPPGGLPNLGVLTDGHFHPISIHWDAATHTLTYSITSGNTTTTGSFTLPPDFNMPTGTQVYGGFAGSGGSATSPLYLQIDGEAFANATSAVIVNKTPVAGEAKTVSGSFGFKDADVSDHHTVSVHQIGGDSELPAFSAGIFTTTITSDANGKGVVKWTYTVDGSALDGTDARQEIYRVTISDGRTSTSTNVTIKLNGGGYGDGPVPHDATVLDDNVISQSVHGSRFDDVITLDMHGATKLTSYVDGAGGENALHLLGQAATIDLSALANHQLSNVSEIMLMHGNGQSLTLSLESVVDMTHAPSGSLLAGLQASSPDVSTSHVLVIDHANLSDHSNGLNLTQLSAAGTWVDTGRTVSHLDSAAAANSGAGYHIYNFVSSDSAHHVLATVAVQAGIDVHLPSHAHV